MRIFQLPCWIYELPMPTEPMKTRLSKSSTFTWNDLCWKGWNHKNPGHSSNSVKSRLVGRVEWEWLFFGNSSYQFFIQKVERFVGSNEKGAIAKWLLCFLHFFMWRALLAISRNCIPETNIAPFFDGIPKGSQSPLVPWRVSWLDDQLYYSHLLDLQKCCFTKNAFRLSPKLVRKITKHIPFSTSCVTDCFYLFCWLLVKESEELCAIELAQDQMQAFLSSNKKASKMWRNTQRTRKVFWFMAFLPCTSLKSPRSFFPLDAILRHLTERMGWLLTICPAKKQA